MSYGTNIHPGELDAPPSRALRMNNAAVAPEELSRNGRKPTGLAAQMTPVDDRTGGADFRKKLWAIRIRGTLLGAALRNELQSHTICDRAQLRASIQQMELLLEQMTLGAMKRLDIENTDSNGWVYGQISREYVHVIADLWAARIAEKTQLTPDDIDLLLDVSFEGVELSPGSNKPGGYPDDAVLGQVAARTAAAARINQVCAQYKWLIPEKPMIARCNDMLNRAVEAGVKTLLAHQGIPETSEQAAASLRRTLLSECSKIMVECYADSTKKLIGEMKAMSKPKRHELVKDIVRLKEGAPTEKIFSNFRTAFSSLMESSMAPAKVSAAAGPAPN